jgi:outer membrane protein assembly factor BamB
MTARNPFPLIRLRFFTVLIALTVLGAASLRAENWAQWRGPFLNGSTTETNLPSTWSKTENVKWTTPLPGWSGATPIVWGDSVFVSSPDADRNLNLLCIDRKDGKVRWQKKLAEGDMEKGRNNMASPSPVTDGKTVYQMFGTGSLSALDFAGNVLWQRDFTKDFGKLSVNWFYGSSPLLYRDRLYVQILQRDPPSDYPHAIDGKSKRESFILCIDPKTGKDIWRHVRPTDAQKESQESYATPIPFEGKNGTQLIIVGGDYVTGHDLSDGHELWRCAGLNPKRGEWMRLVPSPVIAGNVVIACGPKKEALIAVRPDGKGLVTDTHTAWKTQETTPDTVTPLFYQGKLYVLDGDRKTMTCFKPDTGEKIWQGDMGVKEIFRASSTGADGKIYCISERATAVVLDAGSEFKVLATIPMGDEPVRSSIAVSQGNLFIRGAKNLYCIGK